LISRPNAQRSSKCTVRRRLNSEQLTSASLRRRLSDEEFTIRKLEEKIQEMKAASSEQEKVRQDEHLAHVCKT